MAKSQGRKKNTFGRQCSAPTILGASSGNSHYLMNHQVSSVFALYETATDTCLSHYTHVPPQKVLNNTLAEQIIDSWTHKPFALVQARDFSTRMNNQRSHNTRSTVGSPRCFSAAEHWRHGDTESTPLISHMSPLLLKHSLVLASSQQKAFLVLLFAASSPVHTKTYKKNKWS